MIDVKKFLKLNRLTLILIIFIILLIIVPITYSKFQSHAKSNADVKTAFYIIDSNSENKQIVLDKMIPQDEPYTYNFIVANNNGEKRCETNMEYTLTITTTTNLPLTYKLYLNEKYTDPNSKNIIISEETAPDDDGTYFKTIKTNKLTFSHEKDESNIYQLVVEFPKQYNTIDYQDSVEAIIINVDSKQIIENNN
ncbi:MAG: hypothetical protein PUB90_02260 [bacterium]|nr:hypothetical protein [bacterium]